MMVTGQIYGQMDPLACTEGSGLPSLRDRLRSQGKFENPLCLFTGFTPVGRAPSLPKKRARLGIFKHSQNLTKISKAKYGYRSLFTHIRFLLQIEKIFKFSFHENAPLTNQLYGPSVLH